MVGGLLLTAAGAGIAAATAAAAGGGGYLFYRKRKKAKAKGGKVLFAVPLEAIHPSYIAPNGVPVIVERLTEQLLWNGAHEDGIFRQQGAHEDILRLKEAFTKLHRDDDPEALKLDEYSPHVVAGALAAFLMELPEPLCTFDNYAKFIEVEETSADDDMLWLARMKELFSRLPDRNLRVFLKLLPLLHTVATLSDENRMDFNNLGVVFAPLFFWQHLPEGEVDQDTLMRTSLREADTLSKLVAKMVQLHALLWEVTLDQMPQVELTEAGHQKASEESAQSAKEEEFEAPPPSYNESLHHATPVKHVPPSKPLPPPPLAIKAVEEAPERPPRVEEEPPPKPPRAEEVDDFIGT